MWPHEARDFTPWLLRNVDVLSDLLGMDLVLEVAEHPVGDFSLDLKGYDDATGRTVIVEKWSAVADAVGGRAIRLGGGSENRLNPLDPGPRDPALTEDQWQAALRQRRRVLVGSLAESALGRPLAAVEHTSLDAALTHAVGAQAVPTLPAVVDALLAPTGSLAGATPAELAQDGRNLGHALRRLVAGDLAGLFDGPSTVDFDPSLPMVTLDPSLPMVTLDLSGIQGSDQLIAMVMTCASAWMESALASADGGQRWVIYDEAWRLMRQPALPARMQSQWKLSRGLGIANLLIVHRLSDLDAVGDAGSEARALAKGLLGDCSTKIVYQQEVSESRHTASQLGLSSAEHAQLPDLQQGEGLWRVGHRSFVVRHVATDGELALFDTNARMLPATTRTCHPSFG